MEKTILKSQNKYIDVGWCEKIHKSNKNSPWKNSCTRSIKKTQRRYGI